MAAPKPVKVEQSTLTGFAAFRAHYQLSFRDLSKTLGLSRTSAQRLCEGDASAEFLNRHRVQIETNLRAFLAQQFLSSEGIANELRGLFSEEFMPPVNRVRLPLAAQKFFGLKTDPFYFDPQSDDEYFTSPKLDDAFEALSEAVLNQGFAAITGEIGAGKSALKDRLLMQIDGDESVKLIAYEIPELEDIKTRNFITLILTDLDQKPKLDRAQRLRQFRSILDQYAQEGVSVALAIDDAHRLPDRVLIDLKKLWELATITKGRKRRLLGIVLFGQPKLEGRLKDFKFSEVVQRLQIVRMPAIKDAAIDYLAHRLRVAGGDATKLFASEVAQDIARHAATPLALGNLANTALLSAFELRQRRVEPGMMEFESDEPRARALKSNRRAA